MSALLALNDVELYYDHVYALKGVSLEVNAGRDGRADRRQWRRQVLDPAGDHRAAGESERARSRFEGERIDGTGAGSDRPAWASPWCRRAGACFRYMSVRDNLLMGAFSRSDTAGIRATLDQVLTRFPRLKERYSQAAGTMSGGEQQMLVIGRALMAQPKLLLLDEPSLGVAPKIVQDIARSIVAINRDEKVSVLLVEQNSRMALRISHRAYALTTGSIALSGASADLVKDERIQQLYLGGDI